MGITKKVRKASAQGTSQSPRGKGKEQTSQKTPPSKSTTITSSKIEKTTKEDVKSPKGKRNLEKEKATQQESSGKKNKKSTNDPMSTPTTPPAALMSPIRRSSRAPVPSSRFKDMEMSNTNSSKKRSLASSQDEESDGGVESSTKKKRKTSDMLQKNTPKQENMAKSSVDDSDKMEETRLTSVTESKSKDLLRKPKVTSAQMTRNKNKEEKEIKADFEEKGKIPSSIENAEEHAASVDSQEEKSVEIEEQNVVEETITFESTSGIPSGIVVEETVHTYMDEKDVIVVKKPETAAKSTISLTSPVTIGDEKLEKKMTSEIVIKSHEEVMLQEKDGQTVAMINVPSNFGSNQTLLPTTDKSPISDTGNEKRSIVVAKKSSASKKRHGYILNKTVDEPSIVSLAGHDRNAVVNVAVEPTVMKSVLKPKIETQKISGKTYGRVLKQESPLSAVVFKSPRHSSLSEPQGSSSNIVIQNVGSSQSYSLLPQTIKAVSQTEGKTYSLLAPPSELKQMLKGANEKKSVAKGNKSVDSGEQSEMSSSPQKVIIITHPSTSDGVTETSTTVTIPSVTTVSAITTGTTTVAKEEATVEEEMTELAKSAVASSLNEIESKETVETSHEGHVEDGTVMEKGPGCEVVNGNKSLSSDEGADSVAEPNVDTQSSDTTKCEVDVSSSEKGDESRDKQLEGTSEVLEESSGSVKDKMSEETHFADALTKNDEINSELATPSDDKLPVEEVIVTSTDPPTTAIKIEDSQEEGMTNPSVSVLTTALAEAEKSHNSGTLKPQKIKLIENGIVYELQIFQEGERKSQEGKVEENSVSVKEEVADEGEISASDQDVRKFSSGTQTFYSHKRGRPKTTEDADEADAPVHKLATIVQEGDQKKHYYYVSVVPGKTLVGKYRPSADPSLPGCMVNKFGEYCCKECDYKTDKKANFYKHRRLHTGKKPHICPICKYQARTSSNLKRHMGIHEDIREFKCDQCSMSFRQKIHLERHVRYRHEEKRVKCPMCDYVCANEQPDLKMHIKRKHTQESGKTYSCPECKLTVGSRRDLKQHLKFHKDGPELKLFCKECSFVTDCKSRLQRHLVVHSNVKPFQCGFCEYKATQKEHVLRHLRSQHKIEVSKPKRPWKKQVKAELPESAHGNTRGDFTCGDKIFACNHCIMRFAKLINLYKHLHTQHSDIMPVETEGNYYCVVCEFSTSSKKNLLVHMRRHNMTDQTPPTHVYSCVLCRYVNPRRRNLFQHMRKKHNIDISSQVDMAGMKEEEVNAVQEGVKVTELIQTEEGVFSQGSSGDIINAQVESNDGNGRVVGGDIATVANMIKIEDLTRTQINENEEGGEDQSLVIDSTVTGEGSIPMIHASSLMQHKAADAIEGLQALAGQAGFIIEEEVQGSDKQQTIVLDQQGADVLNNSTTTLSDGSMIISADQDVVEEQITIDGGTTEQISQIVESEEALEVSSGLTSLELTEEQLSSLQHGDMVQIEGQVYLVELAQDPDSPDKQFLSFLPVNQA